MELSFRGLSGWTRLLLAETSTRAIRLGEGSSLGFRFSGTLPRDSFKDLKALKTFMANDMKLSGSIPESEWVDETRRESSPKSEAFRVVDGLCTVEKASGCVTSPRYPQAYFDHGGQWNTYGNCVISMLKDGYVSATHFKTESRYDFLKVVF